MQRIFLISLILFFGFVSMASANNRIDSNPITEAIKRAEHYWPTIPCDNHISVITETPPALPSGSPLGTQYSMWATWETLDESQNDSESSTTYTDCVVHINALRWSTWLTDDSEFEEFCESMVHEYGHFEGHSDVGAQPQTVEYEYNNDQGPIVTPCRYYRLAYFFHGNGQPMIFSDESPTKNVEGPLKV